MKYIEKLLADNMIKKSAKKERKNEGTFCKCSYGSGYGSGTDGRVRSGLGKESWKVTCPWAPSGVAAMVSQKAAEKSATYSENLTLVAEAVKGDAATVNTWVADTKANDKELVFVGEGLFSITSILDPAKMQFTYEDFAYGEFLFLDFCIVGKIRFKY